jgi:hypothetical protein
VWWLRPGVAWQAECKHTPKGYRNGLHRLMAPRKKGDTSPSHDGSDDVTLSKEQSGTAPGGGNGKIDDAELARRVDMRAPLIPQLYDLLSRPASLGGLTKDMYLRWVHTPFYYKEEPKSMRFFQADWRESLSKVGWLRFVFGHCPGAAPPPFLRTCHPFFQ